MKHIRSFRIILPVAIIILSTVIGIYIYRRQQPNAYPSLSELEANEFSHSDIIYQRLSTPEPYLYYAVIDTKLRSLSFLIAESRQNAFFVIDRTQKTTAPLSGTLKTPFGSIPFSCNTSNADVSSFMYAIPISDYTFCYSVFH